MMSGSKRRINSTGRKRIPREHIDIRLPDPAPGEPLTATVQLKLNGEDFPASALLVVEAYQRSLAAKFQCGTLGRPEIPDTLDLSVLDQKRPVLFRVRVVDGAGTPGRILGAAERIAPRSSDDTEGRRSIFPVVQRDLGSELWRVNVDDESPPELVLNNSVPAFQQHLLDSPLLQGVLLPAALRTVIEHLSAESDEEEPDGADWKEDWLAFLRDELKVSGDPPSPQDDGREEWVNEAVRLFCERQDFVGRIRAAVESGDQQ